MAESTKTATGRIARVNGPVVDIEFPHDSIPEIYNALTTEVAFGDQKSTLTQRAIFFPQGLGGRLYWMAVTPLHGIVFAGMAKSMGKAAEQHFSARVLATTE